MAGSANALQIFPAVWIPCPQLADKPCWDDVVYMTLRSGSFEIHSAGLHFAISTKSRRSMTAPASSARDRPRPFAIDAFPTHRLLLRPKFCLTELAATVTVGFAAKTFNSEDFCLAVLAVRATHGRRPPLMAHDRAKSRHFGSAEANCSKAFRIDPELGYSSRRTGQGACGASCPVAFSA